MTRTITSFKLTSMALDKTISKYTESLPKDPPNLTSISQYLHFVNDYKSGAKSEHLPVIFPEFNLYLAL